MNCPLCGVSLRWNPLQGIFECNMCQQYFNFHAGHLQSLTSQNNLRSSSNVTNNIPKTAYFKIKKSNLMEA